MTHPLYYIKKNREATILLMRNVFFSFIVVVFNPFIVLSQPDSIDSFIERNIESLHIPGASIVVTRQGKIIKSGGYGMSNLELDVPASTKTVYEIGSMTKQFTSMGIMMLVEEGKLSLDDKITQLFPAAPRGWQNITVRHLLTHTSGIQNHVAVPGYLGVFKSNLFHEGFPDKKDILKIVF
ncbi:serine hydrolase domain-containing protein [Daejeonella sp.]|uniref:serine hydrolase domain-containing protein n=1 Tax=Daejeonella sp. TaxID=2805397 RepID=UPI0030C29441